MDVNLDDINYFNWRKLSSDCWEQDLYISSQMYQITKIISKSDQCYLSRFFWEVLGFQLIQMLKLIDITIKVSYKLMLVLLDIFKIRLR